MSIETQTSNTNKEKSGWFRIFEIRHFLSSIVIALVPALITYATAKEAFKNGLDVQRIEFEHLSKTREAEIEEELNRRSVVFQRKIGGAQAIISALRDSFYKERIVEDLKDLDKSIVRWNDINLKPFIISKMGDSVVNNRNYVLSKYEEISILISEAIPPANDPVSIENLQKIEDLIQRIGENSDQLFDVSSLAFSKAEDTNMSETEFNQMKKRWLLLSAGFQDLLLGPTSEVLRCLEMALEDIRNQSSTKDFDVCKASRDSYLAAKAQLERR